MGAAKEASPGMKRADAWREPPSTHRPQSFGAHPVVSGPGASLPRSPLGLARSLASLPLPARLLAERRC